MIARLAFATVVSVVFTLGSIALVTVLNPNARSEPEARAARKSIMVPLAPAPEPERPSEVEPAPSVESAVAPADARPPVAAPAPAPAELADLAATAGPGGIAVGSGTALPSVAELPRVDIGELARSEPDTAARPIHRPPPVYPAVAQRRGIEGSVTVRLRIDDQGRVVDAVVVASDPPRVFDSTALKTARRYKFTPARSGGKPVATTLEQTIRFEFE